MHTHHKRVCIAYINYLGAIDGELGLTYGNFGGYTLVEIYISESSYGIAFHIKPNVVDIYYIIPQCTCSLMIMTTMYVCMGCMGHCLP